MIDPTNAATIKTLNTIHTAMDEKSAKFIVEKLQDGEFRLTYGSQGGFCFLEETATEDTMALIWYPQPDGNPFGDVEVSDRLLEKMGM